MKVLITGIAGFTGSHLADLLTGMDGLEVYGIERPGRADNIEHIRERLTVYGCDIKDAQAVDMVIAEVRPDRIFHMAAQTFVPASWADPADTLSTNIIGEVNVLEAVRRAGCDTQILIPGSSEEYGRVSDDDLPVREDCALNPLSPYAVSKVAQDMMGYQYFRNYGMRVVRIRSFNLTGPRRAVKFVCSDFARQIAMAEAGPGRAGGKGGAGDAVMRVGNLEARRDFSDVRDMVNGCWLALERGTPGEVYNICSGKARSIKEILDILLRLSRFSSGGLKVEQDPAKMRPSDVPCLVGDNGAFVKATGWTPRIPFERTLEELLDYWRDKIRTGKSEELRCV